MDDLCYRPTLRSRPETPIPQQLSFWPMAELSPAAHDREAKREAKSNRALSVGDRVAIFGLSSSGPTIEGVGVIESVGAAPNQYRIRFVGERIATLRFVHPDWQAAPERSLALLIEFWRSSQRDDPFVEDFFPEGTR